MQAVEEYTDDIKQEIQQKNLKKIYNLGGLRFYTCPVSYITQDTAEIIRMVYLCEASGHLLYGGGWADQPFWFVEAYEMYKAENMKYIESMKDRR